MRAARRRDPHGLVLSMDSTQTFSFSCPDEALEIIRTLQTAGYQAVFAGGCVRDSLLGATPHDWDIATSARPEEVEAVFQKTFPVGRQFGIVLVIGSQGTPYEVASFRGESTYTDGRHPDGIRFVAMEEDVKRRDFTVNALLFDPVAGKLLDFVGGEADLRAGILRAVGEPALRFQEDRLRILRAVRFAANLGFTLEEETWEAVCRHASAVKDCVSWERIREELEKMLVKGASRPAFEMLEKCGLLEELLPEVAAERGVEQPPQFHPEGDVWQHQLKLLGFLDGTIRGIRSAGGILPEEATCPWEERFSADGVLRRASEAEIRWLCWAALLHDIGKPPTFVQADDRIRFNGHDVVGADMASAVLQRMRHSSETVDNVVYLVRQHMAVIQLPQARLARMRRYLQHQRFPLLLELLRLDTLSSFGDLTLHGQMVKLWQEEAARPHPAQPTINGWDLLARGVPSGPKMGRLLQECADYELEHPFLDREDALKWLDQFLSVNHSIERRQ